LKANELHIHFRKSFPRFTSLNSVDYLSSCPMYISNYKKRISKANLSVSLMRKYLMMMYYETFITK